ncbi:hypothetical protein SDJN02_04837, partial [Cucurbita argyrosperma subsp. argyrosperma]
MGRVLYGCALVLVSPAKISCFNGLLHPTFCPFPSRVTFVNCNLTLSVGYRSNPIVAEYVCLDPIAEFVVVVSFSLQYSALSAQIDSENIGPANIATELVLFPRQLPLIAQKFSECLTSAAIIDMLLIFGEYCMWSTEVLGHYWWSLSPKMVIALDEGKLPGAPFASRTSILSAQNHLADDEGKTVCFITKILQYSVNSIDIFVAIHMTYFSQYMNHSGAVLAASEMLCNDGLQAFGLAAVAFAAGVLMRCLSCLTTCNVYFTEIIVICCDSKGNKSGYLLAIFSLISGSRLLRLPLRLRQLLLGFCILFSSQHLYNLCKFQQNVKRAELKQKEMKELQKDQRGTIP